jgi:hypothetical protein
MHIRRFRFLPQFDVLTGRVLLSADALGVAALPAADLPSDGGFFGATAPGAPGSVSDGSTSVASASVDALVCMYEKSPGDGPSSDPSVDPMAPGGPSFVNVTAATPTCAAGAFD